MGICKTTCWPKLLAGVTAIGLSILVGAQMAAAELGDDAAAGSIDNTTAPPTSDTFIELFGCVMPMPPGYVLRADAKPFFFYERFGFGNISVSPFKPVDSSKLEVVGEKHFGPIAVLRIKATEQLSSNRPTLTMIHDGKTRLIITADDGEYWAERMAQACLKD